MPETNNKAPCLVASVVLNTFTRDSRVEKEAEALAAVGYVVTVYALAGEGLPFEEERSGYFVERLPVRTRCFGSSFIGHVIKMIEFSFRLAWRSRKASIFHCHDFHPLPAALLARFTGLSKAQIVYDAHEFESQKNGLTPFRSRFVRLLEQIASPCLAAFISVSPAIVAAYRELIPHVEGTLILNCPRLWAAPKENILRRELGIGADVKIVLYQGGFMPGRHIGELLEAFRMEDRADRALVFLGHAADTPQARSIHREIKNAARTLINVHYLPSVSPELLSEYTSSADIGISLIEDVCLSYRYCLPNKFFEFAMAGLPIVVSDLPEMRRMVEEYKCGVVCSSARPASIRGAIDTVLYGDMVRLGWNARRMAEDNSWERQEQKLLALYDKILKVA
jgi:glycosyltransferase involved in cell wall biosynthesis